VKFCRALLPVVVGACGFSPAAVSDGAATLDADQDATRPSLAGWTHRKSITLLASMIEAPNDGVLAAFPVEIALSDPEIATVAATDGHDLAFTSGDGTPLAYDLETYSTSTGLVAWVAVPSLSAPADTQLYVYYGNPNAQPPSPAATWSSDFMAVYHLQQDPGPGVAGDIRDATSNHHDGTADPTMSSTDRVAGQDGPAIDFDGSNDNVQVETTDFGDTFTISMWIDLDNVSQIRAFLANSQDGSNTTGFRFFVDSNGSSDRQVRFETGNGGNTDVGLTATGAIATQTWTHVAAIVRRATGNVIIAINGVVANATDQTILTDFNTSAMFWIGRMSGDNPFSGMIDEVEIASTARSIEWLRTAYNNQSAPAQFYVVGPDELL
jgi:MSHA biogenesis protein MshQ